MDEVIWVFNQLVGDLAVLVLVDAGEEADLQRRVSQALPVLLKDFLRVRLKATLALYHALFNEVIGEVLRAVTCTVEEKAGEFTAQGRSPVRKIVEPRKRGMV